MEQEFEGKVVLVTGGSRGMGQEMVHAFAERGADVVVASRTVEHCEAVAAEIRDRYRVHALPIGVNVSSWADCDRLVDVVYGELGRVDVLVNNAGASPLYPSLDLVSEEYFDKVIGINLKGPFRLGARIGTRMVEGDGGSIVNIGSVEAIRPQPTALPYAAAKSGLITLTEGFAQAFGPTVRVNAIQPGAFLTDISKAWPEGVVEVVEQKVALARCAEPAEIVGAAVFLAGTASSYVTGAVLRVDGGWR
jgi:NAD(P)-dependent dehydrogenase (short-subunit alcohol dehydrogenase family)